MISRLYKKIRHYHSSVGLRGVVVFVWSKLTGRHPIFKAKVAGVSHPVYVRFGTTDVSVLAQVLIEKHYELPFQVSPKVIIDAGANIGLSAVYFANRYPDATIIALEPEQSNFKMLEMNSSAYSRIKPLHAALWRENGKISLVDPDQGHHGFQTLENTSDGKLVEAFTVDALTKKFGLDFVDILKIDIEGAEKEVFESSSGWMDKVGMVMAELHDNLKPGCSRAFAEATKGLPEEFSNGEIVVRSRQEMNHKPVSAMPAGLSKGIS